MTTDAPDMTTPEQPTAPRLADEYRSTMNVEVLHLWAQDARAELRRQHEVIGELVEALEKITEIGGLTAVSVASAALERAKEQR
jgi:hypothetical protein